MMTAPQPLVRFGELARELRRNRIHFGLRLSELDARLQPRDTLLIVIPTGGALLVGECDRNPDVARHRGP